MKRTKVLFGNRRMMVLLTLAILVLAATALIASSASFTATSANPNNTFTAGNLTLSNDRAGTFILGADNMWPGQSTNGNVTVGNTGDASADFWLTMKTPVDTITAPGTAALSGTLWLNIVETATPANVIYNGPLSAYPAAGKNCGTFASSDTKQYTFKVTFPDSDAAPATTRGTDNKYKNCSTTVEFDWEAVSK